MKDLTLKELTNLVIKQAKEKGFGTDPKEFNVPEKIALLHSEISEAYSAYRHKKTKGKDGFNQELADVLQRLLHLTGVLGIDLEKEVLKKMKTNSKRNWDWKKLNEDHK